LIESKTVEIAQSIWNVNGTDRAALAGQDLTLSTSATPPDDLTPGTSYTVIVKHRNLWWESTDGTSVDSDPVTYVIGAGPTPGVGGALTVTCNFSTSASLGINQFAVPFTTTPTTPIQFQGPVGTPVSINNMQQLVDAINRPVVEGGAGAGTVKTAGWWNKTAQVMVGWTGIDGTVAAQNGAPATLAGEVFGAATMDKVYQMSVARPVSFTLTGTR
jgi:hypothetical protein